MTAALAVLGLLAALSPALSAAQVPLPVGSVAPATAQDPLDALQVPGDTILLSDEQSVTRWAHANEVFPIRVAPSATAPQITRLRFQTEDKMPEVYLVLDGRMDAGGEQWLHIRIPMRPNGRTGWVPADLLSQLYVVRTRLVIDRTSKRAQLFKAGRVVWQAPVGIGKASTPTPTGKFWVRELLKGDGKVFGAWAFGTSAYSSLSEWKRGGVVGIHGTNQPALIPGSPSHGCVRVRNDKITQLTRLMPIGTPIDIVH